MSSKLLHTLKNPTLCCSVFSVVRSFALSLTLFSLFTVPSLAQQSPPYVFYPGDGGYYIERADGLRLHHVGGMDGANRAQRSPRWSPSGKWLAWVAYDAGGCGTGSGASEQLAVAGAETGFLRTYDGVVRFAWSPSRDLILVVAETHNGARWDVIDPAAPDAPPETGSLASDAAELFASFFASEPARTRNDRIEEAAMSADGRWLAYIDDGPVLVNQVSGEMRFIAPSVYGFGGNRGGYIQWHPSRDWLISVEEGVAGCGSSYHTQVTDGEIRYEVGTSHFRAAGVRDVQWLPAHVDPQTFIEAGLVEQPQPFAVLHAQEWITALQWSSDGGTLFSYIGYGDPIPLAAWDVARRRALPDAEFPPVAEQIESYYLDRRVLAESERFVVIPNDVYDKQTGRLVLSAGVDLWTLGGVYQISADERIMIGSAILEPVRIWSLVYGDLEFSGFTATAAALSPDMGIVAVASGWEVRLYTRESLGF